MTPTLKATSFAWILDWPSNHLIRRVSKDENVSLEEATAIVVHYLRYMFIVATYPGHRFPMAKKPDAAWHAHILHTRDYSAFCEKLGRFIHHEPNPEGMTDEDRLNQRVAYARFYHIYTLHFDTPDPDFYPEPLAADVGCSEAICTNVGCGEW